MYFLYILKCTDDTLYTGITNNLEKRIKMHNGEIVGGAKYTRGRRPVELVYFEKLDTKNEALKKEIQVKKMNRAEKLKLIYKQKGK